MPEQDQDKRTDIADVAEEATGDNQHNDWGYGQAGAAGNLQQGGGDPAGAGHSGADHAGGGNIGGVPGSQHNDWGHSPVDTGGNRASGQGARQSADASGLPRQGVMPGEEMGHLRDGQSSGGGGKR